MRSRFDSASVFLSLGQGGGDVSDSRRQSACAFRLRACPVNVCVYIYICKNTVPNMPSGFCGR